jgi:hypothetical protein
MKFMLQLVIGYVIGIVLYDLLSELIGRNSLFWLLIGIVATMFIYSIKDYKRTEAGKQDKP